MSGTAQVALAWLQNVLDTLPTFWEGVVGGIIGAIIYHVIAARWRIIRRKRPPEEE